MKKGKTTRKNTPLGDRRHCCLWMKWLRFFCTHICDFYIFFSIYSCIDGGEIYINFVCVSLGGGFSALMLVNYYFISAAAAFILFAGWISLFFVFGKGRRVCEFCGQNHSLCCCCVFDLYGFSEKMRQRAAAHTTHYTHNLHPTHTTNKK